jgi:hypothetical protein
VARDVVADYVGRRMDVHVGKLDERTVFTPQKHIPRRGSAVALMCGLVLALTGTSSYLSSAHQGCDHTDCIVRLRHQLQADSNAAAKTASETHNVIPC